MFFQYIKALHVIFVVTWFAGLFYIVRLFIYHTEAHNKQEPEKSILQNQYKIMSKRLWYGITYPSMVLTLILGSTLLYNYGNVFQMPWLLLKLGFVLLLVVYHLICGGIYSGLQQDQVKYTSTQLRIWNEVATLLLVAIVFLVILKNALSMVAGLIGFFAFALVLLMAINIYKKFRRDS
jgi:putative membrane protein